MLALLEIRKEIIKREEQRKKKKIDFCYYLPLVFFDELVAVCCIMRNVL